MEECYNYAPDSLVDFAIEAEDAAHDEYSVDIDEVYAAGLLFCSPEWGRELKEKYIDCFSIYEFETLPVHPEKEDIEWMNNVLHILHEMRKGEYNLRKDAIAWLCEHSSGEETNVFIKYDKHITGKSAFPEELKTAIEKIADKYDDISLSYKVTWIYSHLDMGEDYAYDRDECPYITIHGMNSSSIELFIKEIKKTVDVLSIDKEV